MKRVTLGYVRKNFREYYSVYLSSDHHFEFTNKKKAEKFLQDLEEILFQKIVTANELYKSAFSHYRTLFLFIESAWDKDNLVSAFRVVEDSYSMIFFKDWTLSNGGGHVCYQKCRVLFSELTTILRTLHSIADQKRQMSLKHAIASDIRVLQIETKSLDSLTTEVFTEYKLKQDYELRIVS